MPETPETSEDLKTRLIAKAWDDAGFKEALLSQPKATIEKELAVKLPADLKIQVVEETQGTIYLVLPVHPDALPDAKLSDEELEAVAGGASASSRASLASRTVGFGRLNTITYTIPGVHRQ